MDTPPLPQVFNIPTATIQRWTSLPTDAELNVPLTRHDVDSLYFSIENAISAVIQLSQCLTAYTNGQIEEANAHQLESTRKIIEATNKLRYLMNSIMAGASVKE